MRISKKIVVSACFLFTLVSYSQYGWRDGNRIGLFAGPNYTHIISSNLDTKSKIGWTAGGQVRGNLHNFWSAVYGVRFIESNFAVNTRTPGGRAQEVDYKTRAAQLSFLFSYNLIEEVMSIDFGPVLQINGNLAFKNGLQRNTINGTNLLVKDIIKVNNFSGLLYLGTTIGNNVIRANFNYTLGINNSFGKLNNNTDLVAKNNHKDFKGRSGIFTAALLINL